MTSKVHPSSSTQSPTSPAIAAVNALATLQPADCTEFLRVLASTPSAVRTLHRCGLKAVKKRSSVQDGPLAQLINIIEQIDSALDGDVKIALAGNASVIERLQRWGFLLEEKHHEAKLPPQLQNFPMLKEAPNVAAALSVSLFKEAQRAVQDRPGDATALVALQEATKPVIAAYQSAIDIRVKKGSVPQDFRLGEVVERRKSLSHIFGPPRTLKMLKVDPETGEEETVETVINEEQFHSTKGRVVQCDPLRIKFEDDEEERVSDPSEISVQPHVNLKEIHRLEFEYTSKIKFNCRSVIRSGNNYFLDVYNKVWQLIIDSDKEGLEEYANAMKEIMKSTPKLAPRQTSTDPCEVFQHAAKIKTRYETFVKTLVQDMKVKVSIPKGLKKMGRIIEKSILKRRNDPGNANKVCDVVRGMIVCNNLSDIAKIIQLLHLSSDAVLARVKDRFFKCPSGGGWRDCMINFHLINDPHKHICEIQLVHSQMLTARKGLPGHAVYSRVRNADEIVNHWLAKEKPRDRFALMRMIHMWQKGERCVHGHHNLWDVSAITEMQELFTSVPEFNHPIGDWDVSNVVNMEGMFKGAQKFNQPIGKWRTGNVKNMSAMFKGAASFNQPIGEWRTDNVENMSTMFKGAISFNQPIGEWRTENVKNMENMFELASLFDQPIGSWTMENVENVANMFKEAASFKQSLVNWNLKSVKNVDGIFKGIYFKSEHHPSLPDGFIIPLEPICERNPILH